MKKIYFINDWYARLPWYLKTLLFVPIIFVFGIAHFAKDLFGDYLIIDILSLIFQVTFFGWLMFNNYAKNAFIYQSREHFGIRLNGKRVDIDSKFISEVSFDEKQRLQIRRINRVDTFDLSPFRKKDQDKVLRLLHDFLPDDLQVEKAPILSV